MSVLFWALPLRSCGQITLPLRNSVFLSEGGSQAKLSLMSLLELPFGDLKSASSLYTTANSASLQTGIWIKWLVLM